MPRIKITLSEDVHRLLQARARALGCPLSELIANAAIEKHLIGGYRAYSDLADLGELIDKLRAWVDRPQEAPSRKGPRKGPPAPEGTLVFPDLQGSLSAQTTPEEAIAQGLPLHADRLKERLSGSRRELGPVLAMVGGRGDDLYLGSYNSALKVEASTSKRDPDGLAWFPVDRRRAYWVVSTARDYTERIWQKK